ncbi:MAG: hypothetical protein HGB28_04840 [Oscillochloris sp.]|nr:hypothetical protein [Oscillochloris sp.]
MSIYQHSAILSIDAGRRRYVIAQAQVDHLGLLDPAEAPTDLSGRALICRDLGPMLGGAGHTAGGRRHAVTIALRRRSVALLIDHIDSLDEEEPLKIQALSPLLAYRLARPWFIGAVVYRDAPLLLLDLRRIATDVAISAV